LRTGAGVCRGAGRITSGLFTTTLQLGQAVGVATFGSVFLSLAARPGSHASAHALATTLYWLALLLFVGVLAAIPLARTQRLRR